MTEFGEKPDVTFPYDQGEGRNLKAIDATSNVPAVPQMGTTMPAGKRNDENDALGYKSNYKGQTSFEAKEDLNRAKQALDRQLDRNTPSGGKLGNPTNQPTSGAGYDDGGAGVPGNNQLK
jgi:hypothetical protein